MSKIVGVTFPIQKRFIDRFFNLQKTIFVKPATVYTQLKEGMIFVFYQSREDTGFIGEATINSIKISDEPITFFDTFGDALFLTRTELDDYLESTKKWRHQEKKLRKRKWIAIELTKIRKYNETIKPEKFVTVGGRYITEEEKKKFIG